MKKGLEKLPQKQLNDQENCFSRQKRYEEKLNHYLMGEKYLLHRRASLDEREKRISKLKMFYNFTAGAKE